jgi:hypothetical protein
MSIFRRQIVDGLSNLAVEVLAETINKVSRPAGSPPAGQAGVESDIVDVETVQGGATTKPPAAQPALTSPQPASKPTPKPLQTGARPNPAYPPFPFPAPLDLPPVSHAAPPPPTTPPAGPRPRGRPRREASARPPLFPGRNGHANPRAEEAAGPTDESDSDKDGAE